MLDERRDHLARQRLEGGGVAEEAGDPDQQIPEQLIELAAIAFQALDIGTDVGELKHLHASLDPAGEGVLFVLAEVVPLLLAQQLVDASEMIAEADLDRPATVAVVEPDQVASVVQKRPRHLVDVEDQIDEAGGGGAPRHAGVGRGLDVLGHRQAAVLLDRLDAQRAFVSGSRQNDADCVRTLVLGERVEEAVDHGVMSLAHQRHDHPQSAPLDGEGGVGRDDVDPVALDRQRVPGVQHRHRAMAREQLRQHARPAGQKMLDEYERHAVVRRHVLEEGLEGLESARRGANADDQSRHADLVLTLRLLRAPVVPVPFAHDDHPRPMVPAIGS